MSTLAKSAFRTPFDYIDRKWARIHLSFETRIAAELGESHIPARVINFSDGGFLLDCNTLLRRGEIVEIELSCFGKVQGRIAWSANGRVGGAFISAIPANDLVQFMESEQGG